MLLMESQEEEKSPCQLDGEGVEKYALDKGSDVHRSGMMESLLNDDPVFYRNPSPSSDKNKSGESHDS